MESLNEDHDLATNTVAAASGVVAKCDICLRQPSAARYLVADYLPVPRFGRFAAAKAVTIGINPAVNKAGIRALPLISQFGKTRRSDLNDADLISISKFQDAYFDDGKAHMFFDNNFYFILHTIDASWTYQSGRAAHIDVVSCVTDPLWSRLADRNAQAAIRENCRPHFFRTLELVPSGTWLFWGGRETMRALNELNPRTNAEGVTTEKSVSWQMGELEINANLYPFMAWNKIGQGMSNGDRCELGRLVKSRIIAAANGI
jgi:hypothetical protein